MSSVVFVRAEQSHTHNKISKQTYRQTNKQANKRQTIKQMTNEQTKELTKDKLEDHDFRIQNMMYINAGTQQVHIRGNIKLVD